MSAGERVVAEGSGERARLTSTLKIAIVSELKTSRFFWGQHQKAVLTRRMFDIGKRHCYYATRKPTAAFSFSHHMAKKSVLARAALPPKFKSRIVRRCFRCGRKRGYMRDFDACRICFREMAQEGQIPGIKKSSW